MNLVDVVNENYKNANVESFPTFKTGDTVAVHARITEGQKSRIQIFQGVVIAMKEEGKLSGHFRVRKVSSGIGVERVFPFHSPNVEKIEIVQRGKSRRSKLYYLRDRSGKSARIAIDYDRK
ncbi:50S ribosomal protein L19 [Halobacteriovorax sp. GFR7]|uniref:50S ribosomal protein L19 n=1 Tax=unclassified Halobacteriovorax TaxID=2639665 RepID=UPI0037224685